MIYSMTAFGRTQKLRSGYSVLVEIRTLNGRSLDIVLRLPKQYLEFEEALRKLISKQVKRGRIEVFVQIEPTIAEQRTAHISVQLARFYWDQLLDLHRQLPGTDKPRLEDLLRIPHIYEPPAADTDREALKDLLSETVAETLEQVRQMRTREGEALLEDFLNRLSALRQDLSTLEARKETILQEYQGRIRERIQELLGEAQVDENRILQEVACFADRADINEEIVRLRSHFDQMQLMLTGGEAVDGRRLDFLTQELHREVNTMGCKTSDLDAIQAVVRMKGEIGKLKEQVQNVE